MALGDWANSIASRPPKKAESLFELAVAHQIALATAALNSNDVRVCESGVEVETGCLAEWGMFRSQQRMGAVPQWLAYTDDPALDAQNQGREFPALGVDSGAWRSGYEQQPPTGP